MTDDRVTLPLTKTRAAAERFCFLVCVDPRDRDDAVVVKHDPDCLMPDLAKRDLAMATTYLATSISAYCLSDIHDGCSDCACHHHTLKTGRMR